MNEVCMIRCNTFSRATTMDFLKKSNGGKTKDSSKKMTAYAFIAAPKVNAQ